MTNFYDVMDDATFPLIAAKAYSNNNCCDILEFKEDLNRIRSIKKLFNKYRNTGELKDNLIINHLIVFYNVFVPEAAATKMLVWKLNDYLEILKPFLVFLDRWPRAITGLGVRRETIWGSDIPMDMKVIEVLRNRRRLTLPK